MKKIALLPVALILFSCGGKTSEVQSGSTLKKDVDAYLADYNIQFQKYLRASNEGQWKLNTHIVEGDTATSNEAARSDEAMAKFTGSKENIEKAKMYLAKKDSLSDLQVRQLNYVLFS